MKKLLLLGDIVGASGRRCAVRYIRENPHDFVVVNEVTVIREVRATETAR